METYYSSKNCLLIVEFIEFTGADTFKGREVATCGTVVYGDVRDNWHLPSFVPYKPNKDFLEKVEAAKIGWVMMPAKPNYQAIAESLEAENAILQKQVELQTRRLEALTQDIRDSIESFREVDKVMFANYQLDYDRYYLGESTAYKNCMDILSEKTGISA